MKNFKQHYQLVNEFFDAIDGAVKHIDHLEEDILNKGKQGVKEALNQIEAAISYFVSETEYKISTKWDGSPALVAGIDNNGKFFVATKSAFNKERKINYSVEDIERNHGNSPGLVEKLNLALAYLPSLDLKGIYQMDYMFDNVIKQLEAPKLIDGVKNENRFITFQPNTIKYAVSPDSPYGEQIINSKIGVAIHIEYMVKNGILKVKKYTSSPDEFSPSKTVFVFNILADKSKNSSSKFGKILLRDVQKKKTAALSLANSVDFSGLANYTSQLKTYINTEVRSGRFLEDPALSANEFINYITKKLTKEMEALKSDKGKTKKAENIKAVISELRALKPSIRKAFEITRIVANLKNNLIKIFNEITKNDLLGTYMEESPGVWQTTEPEGYALSKVGSSESELPAITKLVTRVNDEGRPGFAQANLNRPAPGSVSPNV
jgi:hypothetical protein